MSKKLVDAIKIIVFLAIGVLLLWAVYHSMPLATLWEDIKSANYFWIGISLVFALISHISRAVRWRMLIEPLGYKPSYANLFFAVMIGYLGNLALPRAGELMRPGVINRYDKVPLQKLIGTILVERGIDFIMLGIIIVLTIVLQFDVFMTMIRNTLSKLFADAFYKIMSDYFPNTSVTTVAVIGIVIGLLLLVVLFFIMRRLRHTKFGEKVKDFLKGLWEGILSIKSLKNRNGFILHTFVIWICYYLMAYLCVYALSSTEHLGPLAGLSILAFGSMGIVAPVQGGIGAYHFIVYQTLLLYGIPETQGKAFAAIVHASQMLFLIVFGFISLILLPIFAKRNAVPAEIKEPVPDGSSKAG